MTTAADAMTYADELAKQAKKVVDIQDACNLVAVLGAWHEAAKFLAHHEGNASPTFRIHPVMVMYLSKVTSLMELSTDGIGGVSLSPSEDAFRLAYDWCQEASQHAP